MESSRICRKRSESHAALAHTLNKDETNTKARRYRSLFGIDTKCNGPVSSPQSSFCGPEGRKLRPFFVAPSSSSGVPGVDQDGGFAPPVRQEENDAYHRQGQVVQQRQGLRFYRARRRQRCVRALLGDPGRRFPLTRRGAAGGV